MRIVCLGEAMLEERVGSHGTLSTHYGGDTLNTAIHLARLGHEVAYATAVGSDDESDALVALWETEGIDCSSILRHPSRTVGRYRISLDAQGERSFSYDRSDSAAREMFALPGSVQWADSIRPCALFVFSLISLAILPQDGREALLRLAREIRNTGGSVVFDGNYRPALWQDTSQSRYWHDRAIALADIGLPTLEDEMSHVGAQDAEDVQRAWNGLGCVEAVVKLGAAGCLLPEGKVVPPQGSLEPLDTSGAGDAFNAGYLAARLLGKTPPVAAALGHRVAGWTIMRRGAIPPNDSEYPCLRR